MAKNEKKYIIYMYKNKINGKINQNILIYLKNNKKFVII